MKFALIYQYDPTTTAPTGDAEIEDWLTFDKQVRDAGVFVYEAGFRPVKTARTVTVRDGAAVVAKGTAEHAGNIPAGLYVIEVPDLDAATDWAQRIPTATYGTVDVRPIVDYDG